MYHIDECVLSAVKHAPPAISADNLPLKHAMLEPLNKRKTASEKTSRCTTSPGMHLSLPDKCDHRQDDTSSCTYVAVFCPGC